MKHKGIKSVLTVIVVLSVSFVLLTAAVIVHDGLTDEIAPCDTAIVLGNKVEPNGQPSARLRARLDKAVELFNQKMFPHVIVSGGTGAEGYDEAKAMKQYLAEHGVPETSITADSAGHSTYATARNASLLMREKGFKSAFLISQYFHISRSRLALRKFGISKVSAAHANFFEVRDIYSTFREVIGFYAYLLR